MCLEYDKNRVQKMRTDVKKVFPIEKIIKKQYYEENCQ